MGGIWSFVTPAPTEAMCPFEAQSPAIQSRLEHPETSCAPLVDLGTSETGAWLVQPDQRFSVQAVHDAVGHDITDGGRAALLPLHSLFFFFVLRNPGARASK